jgi:aminodeoxyfutalosine deaminase
MPGLINAHVHLEFSANKTTLKYGNFVEWLFSVIEHREELIEKATKELIDAELKTMLQNGTTTIGAISSYGLELPSCVASPLNVVYFTEVLGSKPEMIDTLFTDFVQNYILQKNTNQTIYPSYCYSFTLFNSSIFNKRSFKYRKRKICQ